MFDYIQEKLHVLRSNNENKIKYVMGTRQYQHRNHYIIAIGQLKFVFKLFYERVHVDPDWFCSIS